MVLLLTLVAAATSVKVLRVRRSAQEEYRICVAQEHLEACNQMAAEVTESTAKIVCVPERDRSECIEIVKERKADFIAAEPEDMLVAAKLPNQDFSVFEEVRTYEEPDAEFRYEGVIVIHKNLKLNSIQDIKGLNSCHTGVGRTVGYIVPLTKLRNLGILGNLADPELSPRENELKGFSTTFSKSCLVGKWSPDPDINKKLKEKYSNLCALCKDPIKCDYPDEYSGYDGALRCLAHNGGDLAFTKVYFVRKFFGLPIGKIPAEPSSENPDDYAYLCSDGTRVPVRGPPCRWAGRPWPGYVTNADTLKKIDHLRKKLEDLHAVGSRNHSPWLEKVLELSNLTLPVETKVISAGGYLDKANYTDVLEREYGPPFKSVRFCVLSQVELKKCRDLGQAAFSRGIRPRFACVLEKKHEDCFRAIRDGNADVISVSAELVVKGQKDYNLRPIVAEFKQGVGTVSYAVAVVKKGSPYKSFADLKGSRSCHGGFGTNDFIGYNAPLYTLIKLGLIKPDQCPYSTAISEFFSGGSCIPGAKDPAHKVPQGVAEKLCSQCGGEGAAKCAADPSEPYFKGNAFKCLADDKGDVAFVWHPAAASSAEGYELLCPNGGRAPVGEYEKCNLGQEPSRLVVTSYTKKPGDVDLIINALLSSADLYGRKPYLFKLFGEYDGQNNLLFKDATTGLKTVHHETDLLEEYINVVNSVKKC